jgi:hypothetical protein
MNDGSYKPLSVSAIQHRATDLARQLGRSDFTINSKPSGDGSPYVEVDEAYRFIIEERGVEVVRRTTSDLDELLFWIMRGLTFSMAWDFELRNRREGEDSRRQAFAKDLELLERLSPPWAERQRLEYIQILRDHPFHDS